MERSNLFLRQKASSAREVRVIATGCAGGISAGGPLMIPAAVAAPVPGAPAAPVNAMESTAPAAKSAIKASLRIRRPYVWMRPKGPMTSR